MDLVDIDSGRPVICFASDADWANDFILEDHLSLFKEHEVKLNIFATHESEVFKKYDNLQIGVHPNYQTGSSHGSTVEEVTDHIFGIFPEAEVYRAHSYYSDQRITQIMHERGICYDANLCLYMQPNIQPFINCYGTMTFPSFFDDNIHWYHEGSWDFNEVGGQFLSPGLKVINFHPFSVCLNIPNMNYYMEHKDLLASATPDLIEKYRYSGTGARTFLIQILEQIRSSSSGLFFNELYSFYSKKKLNSEEIPGRPKMSGNYQSASIDEKKRLVKEQYDSMDATNVYITSRDFNLRELEIETIKSHCTEGRILDCGCGNGYTLLSLSKQLKDSKLTGVDFSSGLIEGANKLKDEIMADLRSVPEFICADVDDYLADCDIKFDVIITERFIVNLPTQEWQYQMIQKLLDKLGHGGKLILVEGSKDGFDNMNKIREGIGLPIIPDVYEGNDSSKKIHNDELKAFIDSQEDVLLYDEIDYDFYTLCSKVFYPKYVFPLEPKFSSIINRLAREIQVARSRVLKDTASSIGATHVWVLHKL